MNQPIESREYSSSSVIRLFLRRIWHHPLVTDELIKHRHLAFDGIKQHIASEPDLSSLLFVPIGSLVWAIDDKTSDYDFIVVIPKTVTSLRLQRSYPHESANLARPLQFYPVYIDTENPNLFAHKDPIMHLFLTPDNYLFGNQSLAWQIRRNSIDFNRIAEEVRIKSHLQETSYPALWGRLCQDVLEKYFVGWPLFSNLPKGEDDKRGRRFFALLEQRAQQSKNPVLYQAKFINALVQFPRQLPTYDQFKEHLERNDGRLAL